MKARSEQELRDFAYRIYISDTLYQQGQNNRLTKRYIDIIRKDKQPQMSGDEIVAQVLENGGLILEDEKDGYSI